MFSQRKWLISTLIVNDTEGLAIIQDFTAHWAIKNKEMVNVSKCDSVWMQDALIYNKGIELKFYRFTICLFFITQWPVTL